MLLLTGLVAIIAPLPLPLPLPAPLPLVDLAPLWPRALLDLAGGELVPLLLIGLIGVLATALSPLGLFSCCCLAFAKGRSLFGGIKLFKFSGSWKLIGAVEGLGVAVMLDLPHWSAAAVLLEPDSDGK